MKATPFEVLVVAQSLYEKDYAHPSNKKIEDFIAKAIKLLKEAEKQISENEPRS